MHNAGHEGEGQKRQGYQLPDHRHRGALPDRPVLIHLRDAGWMAVQCFQEETVKLGLQSLLNHSRKVRDLSTLTVTLSQPEAVAIKDLLREFRKNVSTLIRESDTADSVYQINIQLFPLTKPKWQLEE